MTRRLLHTFFLLASIAIFTASTHAQQTLGTLLGTVTDPSQAVIPGVAITLTNNDTGLTRTIKTRGNGEYTFNDLPIGTYTLTFTLPDFQVEKHPDVLIQANRTTTLNIRMKLGAQTETVEVRGTPSLNTVDTTNGYVLDSAQIEEIPLGTGSFTQLATLSPGVNADFLADTGTNTGLGNQNIWANGQRLSSNTFTFDGVMANNLFN